MSLSLISKCFGPAKDCARKENDIKKDEGYESQLFSHHYRTNNQTTAELHWHTSSDVLYSKWSCVN